MRTFRAAAVLAACAVLVPAAAAAAPQPLRTSAVTYDAAGTARLYTLVNAYRRAHGLAALTVDTRLADIARTWTTSMATTGDLDHNDALFTKATHSRLSIRLLGENVGFASLGLDRLHTVLLESPHHRENIVDADFAVAGFAVVVDAKGITWVTEDFGSRPVPAVTRVAAPVAPAAPRKPAARPAPARVAPAPVAPRKPAAPAYAAPSAPHRGVPADRVDVPADTAAAATRAVRAASAPAAPAAATVPVASRRRSGDPVRGTAPLVATALAAFVVAGFASAVRGGRRAVTA